MENSEKSDSKPTKKIQSSEQKGEVDKYTRLTQNIQSSKSNARESTRTSQSKPVRESSSSTSKLNIAASKATVKSILTSKMPSDTMKKLSSSNAIKSSKSTGRIQSGYSEKRGISTIYVPQSITSKLNAKPNNKQIASTPKNEEKSNTNLSTSNKSDLKNSKQRRLSRTLSPSEIKMLHSATTRSNSAQRIEQDRKYQPEKKQIDNEYDYEDDFEVSHNNAIKLR